MPKTRLNKAMRLELNKLAFERVHDKKTKAVLDKYTKPVETMILALVDKANPSADMDVLDKYDLTKRSWHIDYLLLSADGKQSRYGSWDLPKEKEHETTWPRKAWCPYGNRPVRIEKKGDIALMNAWLSAEAAHFKARSAKLTAFTDLIKHSRYLEQVEEVWPVAKVIRGQIINVPAVPLAPLMDMVRAIVKANEA